MERTPQKPKICRFCRGRSFSTKSSEFGDSLEDCAHPKGQINIKSTSKTQVVQKHGLGFRIISINIVVLVYARDRPVPTENELTLVVPRTY